MKVLPRALAALACALPLLAGDGACLPNAPCYSAASVVSSADYASGWLSPGAFGTIFGQGLSYVTDAIDSANPGQPLGLGGVQVYVGGLPSLVTYVSATQVNFVVPSALPAASVTLQLARQGLAGPAVTLSLHDSAPALFEQDTATIIADHADWTSVTPSSPARAGESITVYATGLGPYSTPLSDSDLPSSDNPIQRLSEFTLLLNGQPVDPSLISYVGAAPIWIGVYQIDLRLPLTVGRNPEIRIGLGGRLSPPGVLLPVQ